MDGAISVPSWAWGLIVTVLVSTGGLLVSVLAYVGRGIRESVTQLAATVQRLDDRVRHVEGEVLVLRTRQDRAEETAPRVANGRG